MKFLKWIFLLAIGIITVAFALANRTPVAINFPFSDISMELPLYLFFFAALLLGMLLGSVMILRYKLKSWKESWQEKRRVQALENEISALKVEMDIHPPKKSE